MTKGQGRAINRSMRKSDVITRWIYLIGSVIIFTACVIDHQGRIMQEMRDRLFLHLKNISQIEYGTDIDVLRDIVVAYGGQLEIEGSIDGNTVGEYEVRYSVSEHENFYGFTALKEVLKTYSVVDTNPPLIELEKEEVTIYAGSEYDLESDNILAVYDVVDGLFLKEDVIVEADGDITERGSYTVSVQATDSNGLTSSKSYTLIVKPVISAYTPANYYVAYDYLTKNLGFSKAAACGILGNIRAECSFNPASEGTTFYGLCQWGYGRRENLYVFCNEHGYASDSIEGQLEYMYYELTTKYTRVLNYLNQVEDSAEGAYEAAVYFCQKYEGAAALGNRAEMAVAYYNQ